MSCCSLKALSLLVGDRRKRSKIDKFVTVMVRINQQGQITGSQFADHFTLRITVTPLSIAHTSSSPRANQFEDQSRDVAVALVFYHGTDYVSYVCRFVTASVGYRRASVGQRLWLTTSNNFEYKTTIIASDTNVTRE